MCDGDQALVQSDIREIASIAAHLSPLMGRTLTPAPDPMRAPERDREPSPVG
jgi:3-deoxy-7-phosphoheptulonate synthase